MRYTYQRYTIVLARFLHKHTGQMARRLNNPCAYATDTPVRSGRREGIQVMAALHDTRNQALRAILQQTIELLNARV